MLARRRDAARRKTHQTDRVGRRERIEDEGAAVEQRFLTAALDRLAIDHEHARWRRPARRLMPAGDSPGMWWSADCLRRHTSSIRTARCRRHAIDRGLRKFDLSVGNERYKREWCDTELDLYDHTAIATVRGACAALPLMTVRRVKLWIKSNPAVWNAFRKARALAASMKAFRD